jgi:hypothetical protein
MRYRLLEVALLTVAATAVLPASVAGQQGGAAAAADTGWTVRASAAADLWYHGLAVVGFGAGGPFPLYNRDYAERVRAAKQEAGVYPTALDSVAAGLRLEFEEQRVFQVFHFIPLYFPQASPEDMLRALDAVARRELSEAQFFDARTRFGIRQAAAVFRDGDDREVLGDFVRALEQEWEVFLREYWERTVAADSAHYGEVQRRWSERVESAVAPFLEERSLDAGTMLVSPALGPEGRLYEGSPFRRLDNVVAVWSPPSFDDPDASVYAALRELCFSTAAQAAQAGRDTQDPAAASRAAVRCGALLLDAYAPEQVERYEAVFLAAAAATAESTATPASFDEAYPVDRAVQEALLLSIEPPEPPPETRQQATQGPTRWIVRAEPHVDLWFHALAVIAADQPGPLGLYSADYARRIREAKRARGIEATPLDSAATELREDLTDREDLDVFHFAPLYFPRADLREMLESFRMVAEDRVPRGPQGGGRQPGLMGPNLGLGILILDQALQRGSGRRLLGRLVELAQLEWDIFYREYWESFNAEQAGRYQAIQAMWDTLFVPHVGRYLERRKLTAGVVFPSPPIGPEGRIVEIDPFRVDDQVVAVQMPLGTDEPEASVFAFLKELCFLLVDDRVLGGGDLDDFELDDLRRRAAVRCGSLILEFYAPTLASRYRRVFLDAVGAEESYTNEAFERVYFLAPDQFERLREAVRRR